MKNALGRMRLCGLLRLGCRQIRIDRDAHRFLADDVSIDPNPSTPTITPQTSPNKRTAERTTRAGGLRGRSARWGEMMIVNSWARAAW
jgi:hypothetical protein